MYEIGVDLGTSSVKVLLLEGGAVVKTASRAYPLAMPQTGWAEQDPEDWYRGLRAALEELLAGVDRQAVAALSFGGQMHGLVMLDREDRVIRPAILWNDGRAGAEAAWLNETLGSERLAGYTGNIAFAGFTAPKLLWVRSHEPAHFARLAKVMLPKDYLAYRLTGVHSTDYSDASGTLLLDVANRRWSPEMLALCGLDRSQLPALFESWELIGTLRPAAARDLGLPAGVQVAAGAGDNAAAAVGTGTVRDGACNVSLGTSGTVFIANDRFRLPANHALHAFAHATGRYHLMGCILSAAACNQWWAGGILGTADFAAEQQGFVPGGENPVLFAPYLMGERTPHNDPSARGAFVGLSLDTTRAQMTQAVLEGVTFAVRDSVEIARQLGVAIPRTRICGGGARSPVWRQMAADVLRMPVESLAAEEGPGLGAALLAAVGRGAYGSVEEAAEAAVRVAEVTEPDPAAADRYDEAYARFRRLYPALRTVTG